MTCGRVCSNDTFSEWLAPELGPFIQEEDAVGIWRHFARHRYVAAADRPDIGDGVMGARNGQAVTNAVRPPVRPAMQWMRVVSMASARVIAGGMVVGRHASLEVEGFQLHPLPRRSLPTLAGDLSLDRESRCRPRIMTAPRVAPEPPVRRPDQTPSMPQQPCLHQPPYSSA
jgi:hypothetical protein